MEYFVHKRFKGPGLAGRRFNLPYGTICPERDGFIYAPDKRPVCAVTAEEGWAHFRPNTPEGEYRQTILDRLFLYYGENPQEAARDLAPEKFPQAENTYWKSLLRTMPTRELTEFYRARLGAPPEVMGYV